MDEETLAFLASLERDLESSTNDKIVPPGERPCPICGQKMLVQCQHGIHLDVCPEHGTWLDRNELAVIVARIRAGERIERVQAVREACRNGKMTGSLLGLWSLLLD
jgi:Zn-finger nucleic acid-binding protein